MILKSTPYFEELKEIFMDLLNKFATFKVKESQYKQCGVTFPPGKIYLKKKYYEKINIAKIIFHQAKFIEKKYWEKINIAKIIFHQAKSIEKKYWEKISIPKIIFHQAKFIEKNYWEKINIAKIIFHQAKFIENKILRKDKYCQNHFP